MDQSIPAVRRSLPAAFPLRHPTHSVTPVTGGRDGGARLTDQMCAIVSRGEMRPIPEGLTGAMGLRLDYLSCCLTVLSTVLVGRRMWQGWIVASANSAVIWVIAVRTAQVGFVPANLFCLAICGYNIAKWRSPGT